MVKAWILLRIKESQLTRRDAIRGMNMKLTERQISTLKNVDNGYGKLSNQLSIFSLENKGLIKLHPKDGWKLTQLGIDELNKVE